MKLTAIFTGLVMLTLVSAAHAQEWPKTIRGYKLYNAKVKVQNITDQTIKDDKADVFVKFVNPRIVDIGLLGLTVEAGTEITSVRQSGRVDFVAYRDFRVNGIAIDIEESTHPYSFKKGETVLLPKPARVSISIAKIPLASYKQLLDNGNDLGVTGTIFVFGKFKKFGFHFKRVIPIKIDLKIPNPLKDRITNGNE